MDDVKTSSSDMMRPAEKFVSPEVRKAVAVWDLPDGGTITFYESSNDVRAVISPNNYGQGWGTEFFFTIQWNNGVQSTAYGIGNSRQGRLCMLG